MTESKAAAARAPKKRRSANVPGQFYGYSLQITRVVAHFLRAQQGQSVSLEHLDDVATHTAEGIIAEQAKSGFTQNPVSDRSVELWKSLANWVRSVRGGALTSQTKFVLYVAQGHRGPVIDSIHLVATKADANALVQSLRSSFWGEPPKYAAKAKLGKSLAPHVNEVLSASDDVLAHLFMNISLENGSGAPNDDLGALPGMAAISQGKKDDVIKFLLGWAKKLVDKKIEGRTAAVITWDEFHKAFLAAAKKFDRTENVLLAAPVEVTEAELQKELRDRTYVRQLQVVQCDDDDTVRAVHDYLRSVSHRTNWSEDGDVIESSFDDFVASLDRAWKSQKAVVEIEQKSLAEAERGRLLYAKCQQLKVPLQGMEVPDFFVPGSFHAMAESLRVGWHPRYRDAVAALVTGLPARDQDESGAVPCAEPTRKHRPAGPLATTASGDGFADEGEGT